MRGLLMELPAAAVVALCMLALPATMMRFSFERPSNDGRRVIALTGVKRAGVWTDQTVNASNHGFEDFKAATLRVGVGEDVLLRLTSADVTHGFYVPELGLGPLEIQPGQVVEVPLRATEEGVYEYYCTQVCGECHYFMRGKVIVGNPANADSALPGLQDCAAAHEYGESHVSEPLIKRGEQLFGSLGCTTCHGKKAGGGVRNPNAIKPTVPALDVLAERMMLFDEEDAEVVLELLEEGADMVAGQRQPFPRYRAFLAQYRSVHDLIADGNASGRLRDDGPMPPLSMPHWGDVLDEDEITAIVAYLITLQDWNE